MLIPGSSLFTVVDALHAISERQKISSANIANAQTPGYTARQVSFSELLKADNPFETDLSLKMGGKLIDIEGNTGVPVDLQKELIDMQKNMLFYGMASRRATTIFNSLRTASQIGR